MTAGGLLKRLAQLIITVLAVTLFSAFLLELLPGDPVEVLVPFGSDEQREAVREDLDLDQPFIARYGTWLSGFVTGDMGNYYTVSSKRPVWHRLKQAFPKSAQLVLYSQILALIIATFAGGMSAGMSVGDVIVAFEGGLGNGDNLRDVDIDPDPGSYNPFDPAQRRDAPVSSAP